MKETDLLTQDLEPVLEEVAGVEALVLAVVAAEGVADTEVAAAVDAAETAVAEGGKARPPAALQYIGKLDIVTSTKCLKANLACI